MGGLIDKLTHTGLDYGPTPTSVDPVTGMPAAPKMDRSSARGRQVKYYDSPEAALGAGNQALGQVPRPDLQVTPPTGVTATTPPDAIGPEQLGGPTTAQPPELQFSGGGPQMTSPQTNLPTVVKPSFDQAGTDATGMPAASTPGLTRLGKLAQILGLAAKGAVAGQASSERAVAESGGHRGGGFGTGFVAGMNEPAREVAQRQAVEHGALANQSEQQKIQAYPWMRQMQMATQQARINRDNATAAWRQWMMNSGGKATVEETIAAKQKIAQAAGLDEADSKQFVYGIKPEKDATQPHDEWSVYSRQHPGATIEDFWKARQKLHPGASETSNEFRNWMSQNPGASVEDYWNARNATPHPATRGQEAAAVTRKKADYDKLESQYRWDANNNEYVNRKDPEEKLSPEEFTRKKQDVQDSFEEKVATLSGGVPEHKTIPVSDAQAKTPSSSGAGAIPQAKPKTATPATPKAGQPQKGQRKTYKGHPYEFDGSTWNLTG